VSQREIEKSKNRERIEPISRKKREEKKIIEEKRKRGWEELEEWQRELLVIFR